LPSLFWGSGVGKGKKKGKKKKKRGKKGRKALVSATFFFTHVPVKGVPLADLAPKREKGKEKKRGRKRASFAPRFLLHHFPARGFF